MKLRLKRDKGIDDDIDIAPMIDCVFLLVLFFMVTSSFIEEAKVFKVVLPRADAAITVSREGTDSVSVTVEGAIVFRGPGVEKPCSNAEELLEVLKARPAGSEKRPVILRCDARCEYRQFVQVKNVLKLAGVETIFEEVQVGNEPGKS